MRSVEIEKISETQFRRVTTRVLEDVVIDLKVLEDNKANLQAQKQVIINDFDGRIAAIDDQIAEAKNKGVKTEEEANKEPDRPDPKTVERG
jgi:hypothetical protein